MNLLRLPSGMLRVDMVRWGGFPAASPPCQCEDCARKVVTVCPRCRREHTTKVCDSCAFGPGYGLAR